MQFAPLDAMQLYVAIIVGLVTIIGTVWGIIIPIWKHRKELEQARVNRILRPLRNVNFKLITLIAQYKSEYNHDLILPSFYSNLEQTIQIIKKMFENGLHYDIARESKSLNDVLTELSARFLKADETYYLMRSQIRCDDKDSLNRLFDEHRMRLFRDERIRYLIYHLHDELNKWLQKHT